jgi:hypothetical protein
VVACFSEGAGSAAAAGLLVFAFPTASLQFRLS